MPKLIGRKRRADAAAARAAIGGGQGAVGPECRPTWPRGASLADPEVSLEVRERLSVSVRMTVMPSWRSPSPRRGRCAEIRTLADALIAHAWSDLLARA